MNDLINAYLRAAPQFSASINDVLSHLSAKGIAADEASVVAAVQSLGCAVEQEGGILYAYHEVAAEEANMNDAALLWAGQDESTIVRGALVASGFRPRGSRRAAHLASLIQQRAAVVAPDNSDLAATLDTLKSAADFAAIRG
jgi:hypothetical protein